MTPVVKNGSNGGTSAVAAESGVLCLKHPGKCGVGASVRKGF